jgi:2',3'-cyclic-nucleotide 2'-phosphodiesterase (5'-nucleotidase family)
LKGLLVQEKYIIEIEKNGYEKGVSGMRKKSIISITLAVVLMFAGLGGAVMADNAGKEDVPYTLTILHNNDGESALINLGAGLEDFGGVARFATVVQREKVTALVRGHGEKGKRGVVMVSSGDNFLAGPEFSASLNSGTFFDAVAMDIIGYDAVALGNHDFDFGPDVLADFIEEFHSPRPVFLSANLDFSGEPRLQALVEDSGQHRIVESMVMLKAGEKIGLIGATTPMLPFISSPRNISVIGDVAGEVQAEVDKLELMGVNKIILISHMQDINADLVLLGMLDGVDVAVAGGGDELLANEGDLLVPGHDLLLYGPYPLIVNDSDGTEVPVVTTAGSYGYLGKLVVEFDCEGNVVDIGEDSGPIRIAGGDNPDAVRPHRPVQHKAVEPVVEYVEAMAGNVLAISEVDLDGLRSSIRYQETNEGNMIADALLWQATELADSYGVVTPDVAIQNAGGIRNDSIIPAGPITELDTFDMVPFPNFVTVLENIPRDQFKEILENAVSSVDTGIGSGKFAQVAGFRFTWDAAGTAQVLDGEGNVVTPGTRIQEATLDDETLIISGGVVVPGPDLTVATIDFLARGGDQYPYRGAPFVILGVTYQQAIANYLQDPAGLGGTISASHYPFGGEGRITRLN